MSPKINTVKNLLLILAMALLTACQAGRKNEPKLLNDLDSAIGTEGLHSLDQIYHLYPSPAEMLSIIDITNTSYDESILNPTTAVDQYMDSRTRSYNLGIYMTDLAYTALFGRHEATLDYLEVVRALAEEIRIEEAVNDVLIDKARSNVEDLDSLYQVTNDAFMNILEYCDRTERSNTVVMLSAGAFSESLFLAVSQIDDYQTADDMLQHLADQKYTINNFMRFAESVKGNDPNVTSTIADLQNIKRIYDGISPGTGQVKIKTNEDETGDQPKKLVIGSGGEDTQPSMNEEEFLELKSAIIELRTKIIEGS